jgi:hypothetical protein
MLQKKPAAVAGATVLTALNNWVVPRLAQWKSHIAAAANWPSSSHAAVPGRHR